MHSSFAPCAPFAYTATVVLKATRSSKSHLSDCMSGTRMQFSTIACRDCGFQNQTIIITLVLYAISKVGNVSEDIRNRRHCICYSELAIALSIRSYYHTRPRL
jgi:hypothetical protein